MITTTKADTRARLNHLFDIAEKCRQAENWQDLGTTLEEAAECAWRMKHFEAMEPLMKQVDGLIESIRVNCNPRCNSVEEHNAFPHGRF